MIVRVDISGKVFDAENTAKVNVTDCTCSGVIMGLEVMGTGMIRVYVISVLGSNILHSWRPVLVQVNMSWSPGHTDVTIEGTSVNLPAYNYTMQF